LVEFCGEWFGYLAVDVVGETVGTDLDGDPAFSGLE
jgi:hypothetical protein